MIQSLADERFDMRGFDVRPSPFRTGDIVSVDVGDGHRRVRGVYVARFLDREHAKEPNRPTDRIVGEDGQVWEAPASSTRHARRGGGR